MSCPFAGDGSLTVEDFAAPPKRAAAQSHLRTFTDGDKCPAREVIEKAEARSRRPRAHPPTETKK